MAKVVYSKHGFGAHKVFTSRNFAVQLSTGEFVRTKQGVIRTFENRDSADKVAETAESAACDAISVESARTELIGIGPGHPMYGKGVLPEVR